MKSQRLFLGTFLLAFVLSALPSLAAVRQLPPDPVVDRRILIKAVDLKDGTVTFKYMRDPKEPSHSYRIDISTTIYVNDDTATLDKVKVGMQVREYTERDADTLDSLSVSRADPPPVKPKK